MEVPRDDPRGAPHNSTYFLQQTQTTTEFIQQQYWLVLSCTVPACFNKLNKLLTWVLMVLHGYCMGIAWLACVKIGEPWSWCRWSRWTCTRSLSGSSNQQHLQTPAATLNLWPPIQQDIFEKHPNKNCQNDQCFILFVFVWCMIWSWSWGPMFLFFFCIFCILLPVCESHVNPISTTS